MIDTFYKNSLHSLDSFLKNYILHEKMIPKRMKDAITYAMTGGKKIRALLCYIYCDMFGVKQIYANYIALSIEMIHAYSIIHDDLPSIDNDSIRRGRKSCHIKFDEATAIITGDILQSLAFKVLSEIKVEPKKLLKAINFFASKIGSSGMAMGQQLDLEIKGKTTKFEELVNIYKYKTGSLFSLCAIIPYRLSPLKYFCCIENHLKCFSEKFGIAFQIQDDIVDSEKNYIEPSNCVSSIGIKESKIALEKYLIYMDCHLTRINKTFCTKKLQQFVTFYIDKIHLNY